MKTFTLYLEGSDLGTLQAEDETGALEQASKRYPGRQVRVTWRRACSACGGDGWTPGMAEYRRDNRLPVSSECVFCKGTGFVHD